MAKKYPKITLTQKQYNFITELLKTECTAVTEEKACIFIFNKSIKDIEHGYCSTEYNTIQYIIRAIKHGYDNRLNIVEEV